MMSFYLDIHVGNTSKLGYSHLLTNNYSTFKKFATFLLQATPTVYHASSLNDNTYPIL